MFFVCFEWRTFGGGKAGGPRKRLLMGWNNGYVRAHLTLSALAIHD
jgi:hypothetical protein